jgi:hypothetical protein
VSTSWVPSATPALEVARYWTHAGLLAVVTTNSNAGVVPLAAVGEPSTLSWFARL